MGNCYRAQGNLFETDFIKLRTKTNEVSDADISWVGRLELGKPQSSSAGYFQQSRVLDCRLGLETVTEKLVVPEWSPILTGPERERDYGVSVEDRSFHSNSSTQKSIFLEVFSVFVWR